MKKILIIVSVLSFGIAGSVTPVLGMRFNDIASAKELPGPVTTIGLKMEVSEGVYSGFDSNMDGTGFRIFVERSFGKIGLSSSEGGEPTFTIGAVYSIYSNLNVELEYMVNQAVADEEDNLRMSLTIPF